MIGEPYQIETRRRSRSKTPFLHSNCDQENCERAGTEGHMNHKKKKQSVAPNVQTIMEEHVVETKISKTTSSSSSSSTITKSDGIKTTRSKAAALLTSDYSSEDVTPEPKRKATTVTTMITNTGKRFNDALNSLTAVTSTPRSELETAQNVLNTTQELQQQEQRKSRSNGNSKANLSDDHLAYIEYRNAGEYWNKTPKTDYTYSELSPHRRQLAPGIVAMPNMSRRSLEHHDQRVNYMVDRNPAQEEFIRRRYQANYTHLNYDSADEVDNTQSNQQVQTWWLLRVITSIVSSISSVWTSIANISETESSAYQNYYAKRDRQPKHGLIVSSLLGLMRYIYIGIASVLSLDTWLLRSKNPENKWKKRFLLFLLLLLPVLMVVGVFYYLHPHESFPPRKIRISILELPEIPKIDIGAYLNVAQFETLRSQAIDQAVRVRDWADDYLVYLRTIGQNVVSKGRQWFQPNVYYDRV